MPESSASRKTGFATIDDVAKLASVSRITVSRAFSGKWKGKVRPETVQRVLQAARELQYTPNNFARGLTSRTSGIVAVAAPARPGFFLSHALSLLAAAVPSSGRQAMAFPLDEGEDLEGIAARMLQYRTDGVITTSAALTEAMLPWFRGQASTSIILLGEEPGSPEISGVWSDEAAGARSAARHLYETGHRSIAVLSGNPSRPQRVQGFLEQLGELGLFPADVLEGGGSHASGSEAASFLMRSRQKVDAIFCDGDALAMGALDALRREWGVQVPGEISVMGFGGSPAAALPAYSLTTVAYPVEAAIDAVLAALPGEDGPVAPRRRELPMKLTLRSTVADGRESPPQ